MKNYREQDLEKCCGKCEHGRFGDWCGESSSACVLNCPEKFKGCIYNDDEMGMITDNVYREMATWIDSHKIMVNGICDNYEEAE